MKITVSNHEGYIVSVKKYQVQGVYFVKIEHLAKIKPSILVSGSEFLCSIENKGARIVLCTIAYKDNQGIPLLYEGKIVEQDKDGKCVTTLVFSTEGSKDIDDFDFGDFNPKGVEDVYKLDEQD